MSVRRRSLLLGAAALAGGALTGCAQGPAPGGPASPAASPSSLPPASFSAGASAPDAGEEVPVPGGDPASTPQPGQEELAAARPVRVLVPAIGVDADVVDLGVTPDGALEVPSDGASVGWFTRSALPGERGPQVLAGHVDDERGPAVFYRLRELEAGAEITVVRADGAQVGYRVDGVERYPKDAFPTATVYGPSPGPVLRLITCGGTFDRSTGHYRDNTVAYATVAA